MRGIRVVSDFFFFLPAANHPLRLVPVPSQQLSLSSFCSSSLTSALLVLSTIYLFMRAPKKNTSHGNEVLPQDTTHLKQRPCYQRGSPCQDPAGNRTTRRRPDHFKETQAAVVWSCVPFIRSGQNHLSRHSERGKKTRQTEEEVGRQHQGMDRPGVRQVPEGSVEQEKNGGNWLPNHLWCPNVPRG